MFGDGFSAGHGPDIILVVHLSAYHWRAVSAQVDGAIGSTGTGRGLAILVFKVVMGGTSVFGLAIFRFVEGRMSGLRRFRMVLHYGLRFSESFVFFWDYSRFFLVD